MDRTLAYEHRHDVDESDRDHIRQMAEIFGFLGDPTRLALLLELMDGVELCVGDLASKVDVTDTAVSHALRLLKARNIVRPRRDGNRIYYSLVDEHVRVLVEATASHLREAH